MVTLAIAALVLGGVIGLRYNAWALLLCLCASVPVMTAVMLVSGSSISSTALEIILALASTQVGYLGGAYVAQIGQARRPARPAPFVVNRQI
jgi:hypothetical protein